MINILNRCDQIQKKQPCCHTDGRQCNCINCIADGFYSNDQDTYGCLKRLCFYTMNYGPMYASEIYHFLNVSGLIDSLIRRTPICILSLGCGFGPDFIAINRYIRDNNKSYKILYTGYDVEKNWQYITNGIMNNIPIIYNVFNGLSLQNFHIVFLNKIFSTLHNNNESERFLELLTQAVQTTLPDGSYLAFNDVNHFKMGRDIFDNRISQVMVPVEKYFFNVREAYSNNYIEIPNSRNIFQIPQGLPVSPLQSATKSVFFLYQKRA